MADINHLQIAISTKYHKLWYTTAELELGDSHVTKFKIADGHHFKNCFFGHNSAADFPISVKVCAVKQFFHRISAMEQILAFAERIFCFPNAVLASVSGGVFVLSLIHFSSLFSSFLFSSGQTAVKLSGAEAADRAQCAAPD